MKWSISSQLSSLLRHSLGLGFRIADLFSQFLPLGGNDLADHGLALL